MHLQRFSARRTVDLKAQRVGVNQEVDLDLRLESTDNRSMFVK